MPPADSAARVPLGPIGGHVMKNVTELRRVLGLTYKDLSDRLEQLGRPIPTLGLSRIEKGNRRVDADDLVALALALGVNPSALLLPRGTAAEEEIELSPATRHLAWIAWQWADGQEPLPALNSPETESVASRTTLRDLVGFREHARPRWAGNVPQFDVLARIEELEKQLQAMRGKGRDAEAQPVVAAIVTSPLGVLAGRRNDGKPPWTFIAGEVEPGERPEDAAVREVKEETGCLVRAGRVLGQRVHPKTGRTMIYMAVTPTHGTDVFVGDKDELAEVRWLSLAEAGELLPAMFEPVREHLERELGAAGQ